jgi:hypothetical protein
MVILRMVIRRTVTATGRIVIHTMGGTIPGLVTAMVRTVIRIMDGTIPGLGTATVHTDIRTIGDQSNSTKPTRPSTYRARLLFSRIRLQTLKTQVVSHRAP